MELGRYCRPVCVDRLLAFFPHRLLLHHGALQYQFVVDQGLLYDDIVAGVLVWLAPGARLHRHDRLDCEDAQ